jgi:uncharacterized protein (DUF58 family)
MIQSNLSSLDDDDPQLFMVMEDLELAARGIVEGALLGLHRSPYIGFSVEFESHREYQRGDDLRYVNWKLWARHNRLFVKQFKSDTNMNIYLMLDSTGSMQADHGVSAKWRYGARAAAALALLARQTHDAPGLFILNNKVEQYLRPRSTSGHFHDICGVLQNCTPQGQANIGAAIEEAYDLCRRKGIVFFISDLFDKEEDILNGLTNLRHMGHEVVVLQILDPWELEMPESGQYAFHDLETGEVIRANVARIRDAYKDVVADWQQGFKDQC